MTQADRPPHIAAIMRTVNTEYPSDMVATLETYLAELEARQPEQLGPIAAILRKIVADLPLDAGAALTAYIASLEARLENISPAQVASPVEPESLYWRLERRASQRRERALRKMNYH